MEQVISETRSHIVRMSYDGEGSQTALYTGLSGWDDTTYIRSDYTYDRYGNLVSETDGLGQETTYTYDLSGNMSTSTDRNNVTTTYAYDALNRPVSQYNSKDGIDEAIRYGYDLNGSLKRSSNASGSTFYAYDSLGRVTTVSDDQGLKKTYTYDRADRVKSLTVLQGSVAEMDLTYEYDAAGRMTCLVSSGVRYTYAYNAAGLLTTETNGMTGVVSDYAYYPTGAIKTLRTYANGELVNNFEYAYDLRGNQTRKDENGEATEYYYDALSRLKTAFLPNDVTQDYAYDDCGNISRMAEISGHYVEETQYYYDKNNRLLLKETTAAGGDVTANRYDYDTAGNQIYSAESATQNGITTTSESAYLYNGLNQLVAVIDPNEKIYAYAYNTEGLRASKSSDAETIHYLYENGSIILETDAEGFITAKNVWGQRLLYRETENVTYGYLFNGHGDIIGLTDENGAVVKDYAYDPYGNEAVTDVRAGTLTEQWSGEVEAADNPFRYCGEYYDLSSGTYYLRARYYDPTIGRFLSEDTHWNPNNMIYGDNPVKWNERQKDPNDPLGLNTYTYVPDITAIIQSGNLYVYCMNNPIRYVDSTGELAWPGEIHNAVSNHILWTQLIQNGRLIQPNKFVSYGGLKFGIADLYDNNTGEVWEIKPDKRKYYISGPLQLQNYIDHIDGASKGKSLGGGSFYYFSSGKITPLPSIYQVTYRSGNDGMIYYSYEPIVDSDAVAVALAAMAAAILSGTYNGSTVPIPAIG